MKKALFRQKYSEEDGIRVITEKVEEISDINEIQEEKPQNVEVFEKKKEEKKRGRKHNI